MAIDRGWLLLLRVLRLAILRRCLKGLSLLVGLLLLKPGGPCILSIQRRILPKLVIGGHGLHTRLLGYRSINAAPANLRRRLLLIDCIGFVVSVKIYIEGGAGVLAVVRVGHVVGHTIAHGSASVTELHLLLLPVRGIWLGLKHSPWLRLLIGADGLDGVVSIVRRWVGLRLY